MHASAGERLATRIWLVAILPLLPVLPVRAADSSITIIASAESHGAVRSCECPDQPGGGMPRRITELERERTRGPVLLLDAGGFSAGGPYDTDTRGRAADSLRTIAMIRAMGLAGYDAVAVGDDDLLRGAGWLAAVGDSLGLPLLSANCRTSNGGRPFDPHRIVSRGGVRFGITAVTTREQLFALDTTLVVEEPVESIRHFWPELLERTDFQIILAHLGEEQSATLYDAFPECDLVVNGHRKQGVEPVSHSGGHAIMQFGFKGSRLSRMEVRSQGEGSLGAEGGRWIEITDTTTSDAPADEAVSALMAQADSLGRPVIDLYLMSLCPYGLPALGELLRITDRISGITPTIWFVGTVREDGTLRSLRGEREIQDEMLWLAVQAEYPHMWRDFLHLRAETDVATSGTIADLGLDSARIARWVARNGRRVLRAHYYRSQRLGIKASPSVLWNNIPLEYDSLYVRVGQRLCEAENVRAVAACDSLPECLHNGDCSRAGMVGICNSRNRCTYQDPVTFRFLAIVPESLITDPARSTITTTRRMFPGAAIETVSASSRLGKRWIQRLRPKSLPLYLFDARVRKSPNFPQVAPGLVAVNKKWMTFKEGVMPPSYLHNREAHPGALKAFVDPAFPQCDAVLQKLLSIDPQLERIEVYPLVFGIPDSTDSLGQYRWNEAFRWMVAGYRSNRALSRYLAMKQNHPRTHSEHDGADTPEAQVELDAEVVEQVGKQLNRTVKTVHELQLQGPVVLLAGNREVVTIEGLDHLATILRRIGVTQNDR